MPDPDRIARARRVLERAFPNLPAEHLDHAARIAAEAEDPDDGMAPVEIVNLVVRMTLEGGGYLVPQRMVDAYRERVAAAKGEPRPVPSDEQPDEYRRARADLDANLARGVHSLSCGECTRLQEACGAHPYSAAAVLDRLAAFDAWWNRPKPEPRTEAEVLDRPSMRELLDRSSLGTPEAKAAIASVPPELAEEIVRRADGIAADGRWITPPGGSTSRGVFLGTSSRSEAELAALYATHPTPFVRLPDGYEWPDYADADEQLLASMAVEREGRRIQRELLAAERVHVVLGIDTGSGIEIVGPGMIGGTADAFTFTPDRASDLAESSLLDRCPQPCEHLSQHDAREGRGCAEHPCTCDPATSRTSIRYPGPGVPPAVYVVRSQATATRERTAGVFHFLGDAEAELERVTAEAAERIAGDSWADDPRPFAIEAWVGTESWIVS